MEDMNSIEEALSFDDGTVVAGFDDTATILEELAYEHGVQGCSEVGRLFRRRRGGRGLRALASIFGGPAGIAWAVKDKRRMKRAASPRFPSVSPLTARFKPSVPLYRPSVAQGVPSAAPVGQRGIAPGPVVPLIGLPVTTVPTAGNQTMTIELLQPFQAGRLVLSSDDLADLQHILITDIKIGRHTAMMSDDPIPATAFAPSAEPVVFQLPAVPSRTPLKIDFSNTAAADVDITGTFSAVTSRAQ